MRRAGDFARGHRAALATVAAVLAATVMFVVVTGSSPAYDAFGWLVWGHQTLHWNLNTDGAPSWKPLTYLFALPYALFGRAQLHLWVWTATLAAFTGCALAARIIFRLVSPDGEHRWAALCAAAFTACGIFALGDFTHLMLITSSDPVVMALCLAAVNAHLAGRPRWAFAFVVLAGLGRPEAWPFALLYAALMWRAEPRMRPMLVVGILLFPLCWFSVPAITSRSAFISGDLALNAKTVIHGNKLIGVITRLRNQAGWPLEVGTLAALGFAAWRRDARVLAIGGLAVLWTLVEWAFALHGWSAVSRYLIEPAALMVTLSGVALGQALTLAPRRLLDIRWAIPALGVAMVLALVPYARTHERTIRYQVGLQHGYHRELNRLTAVIAKVGGAELVRSCGQPVTFVGEQSAVAWALGMNVGDVGFHPGKDIAAGTPVVVLRPHKLGWTVRAYNMPPTDLSRCEGLRTETAFG